MTAQKSIETTYCAVVTITGNNLQYLSDNVADPSKFCSNPDQSCQNIPEYFKSAKLFYNFMFLLKKKTDLILQKFTKTYLCPFMRTSFNICSGFIIINNSSLVKTQSEHRFQWQHFWVQIRLLVKNKRRDFSNVEDLRYFWSDPDLALRNDRIRTSKRSDPVPGPNLTYEFSEQMPQIAFHFHTENK